MGVSAFINEISFNKIRLFYRLDKPEGVCVSEKRLGGVAWNGKTRRIHIFTLLSVQDKHSEFGIAEGRAFNLPRNLYIRGSKYVEPYTR